MAQKTFVDGDVLNASDINTYLMGEGGAWTNWTPTCTQSGAVTVTVTRAKYARWSRLIVATFELAATSAGTTANAVEVSLPVNAAATLSGHGSGYILDNGTAYYSGVWSVASATTMQLFCHNETGAAGIDPAFAIASGDLLRGVVIYEAAS